jgi:hypothetical protein
VQRSRIDDQKNNGKMKIKSLVDTRLKGAREAMVEAYETQISATTNVATNAQIETGTLDVQGIFEVVPIQPSTQSALVSGTYGALPWSATVNTWWKPKWAAQSTPAEVNLVSDMRTLYNNCSQSQNSDTPDLIFTTQTWFELYEDYGLEMAQIVKDTGGQMMDLGFEVLRFKGKPLMWTSGMYVGSKNHLLMLNSNWVEVVYDPSMWFEMTEWKEIPLQLERIAHILCALNVVTSNRRRNGVLYEA